MVTPMLILLLLAPVPAIGEARGRAVAVAAGEQLICRTLAETGSRLAEKRVCMTRAGWAEHKRLQRSELERMQVNGGIPGAD